MGKRIDRDVFDERDYARFQERVQQCLLALGELLERPGFGVGPATVGAELELFLVDGQARPLPRNQAVRAAAPDPRITFELDRCDLELNASPTLLAGDPFTALGEELTLLLGRVTDAAGARSRWAACAHRRSAHDALERPASRCDNRRAALPGAEPWPASAAPGLVPDPDRGRRPVGAGQ
jgi:hypothetical protein